MTHIIASGWPSEVFEDGAWARHVSKPRTVYREIQITQRVKTSELYMRALFLTIANFESIEDRGVYTDLLREFRDLGHDVCVVCPAQRREGGGTRFIEEDGVRILRVRTGNLTKSSLLEKAVSTLMLERSFIKAIDYAFPDLRFDLILYSTPPVTLAGVVEHVKRRDGSVSYLLLKDIFPQNAVDLGLIRRGGLVWRYFRHREQRLYRVSDRIGCMSRANVQYLIDHNPDLRPDKVEVCPNAISPIPLSIHAGKRETTRRRLGLSDSDVLFLYAGNFGKPQGFDFILECVSRVSHVEGAVLMLVGSGTEFDRAHRYIEKSRPDNVKLLRELPRDDYDILQAAADVGLIFLDHRFTIPNFPSRLTSYMEAALPVIAATDSATDVGAAVEAAGGGVWVPSDNPDAFIDAVRMMTNEPERRRAMGTASRKYLEEHYTARDACLKILRHFGAVHATTG